MQKWEYYRLIVERSSFGNNAKIKAVNGQSSGKGFVAMLLGYPGKDDFDGALAELGSQGWELVSAVSIGSEGSPVEYLLKRPVQL